VDILLENVRCFCDSHEISLRPLTLLVGENSTGKTTFLAMLGHVSKPDFPLMRPSFNEEPFDLGSFDSIATFKGGRYGRADSFSVGLSVGDRSQGSYSRILATYGSYKGQPLLTKFVSAVKDLDLTLEVGQQGIDSQIKFTYKKRTYEIKADLREQVETGLPPRYLVQGAVAAYLQKTPLPELQAITRALYQILPPYIRGVAPVFAMAPVRTKPRRTYDEVSDEFRPEGQHIPIQLARLWQEEGDSERAHLNKELLDFGKESSLFKRVGVKRLGRRPSDPFQILVTTDGPAVNLLDVGYGVSQALPLLVESVLATKGRRLLIQQPEVHLHPRGQAALGSFFAHLVSAEKKEFVIETHSDYILDRIRMEVANGNLRPEDLSILFFEKHGIETRLHSITVDQSGNIVDAPDSYRQFFMEEELRLMGRSEK
jgi:hypothetical protein